jgi:hypothetical protein
VDKECATCLDDIRKRIAKVMEVFYTDGVGMGQFELELLYCYVAAKYQKQFLSDEADST